MTNARLTGPDVLTVARGALAGAAGFAAVWLALASSDAPGRLAVAVALGVAAVADGLDGWWARRIGNVSARGARLDTAADLMLAAGMLAAAVAYVAAPPTWLWIACAACVIASVAAIDELIYASRCTLWDANARGSWQA